MNWLKENWFKVSLLGVLILVGVGVSYKGSSENPVSGQDTSFEKREKCANYREEAQIQLEETYSIAVPFFYDIFYSPKEDSCVYTHGLILMGDPPNERGSFVIVDYFSGDILFSVDYDNSSEDRSDWSSEQRPKFSAEVEGYRK